MHNKKDHVFHRDFLKDYPIITHGERVYLFDSTGKRYLDASSGAISANLGHGVKEITSDMAAQANQVAFVHTLRFETEVLFQLAQEIAEIAPSTLNRVYFTSGGSEANESAIKLARQYHRDKGKPEKNLVIGRWQSYHGNTLGSLSAGGDIKRRKPYTSMLLPFAHVYSPFCLHCPYSKDFEECNKNKMYCIDEIERLISEIGPEFISCFICEPIVGSQQGAVVPPDGYFKELRRLCDKYDIILIVDEVMTGFGRTGKHFAIEHFDIEPDIITFGKGVSAGYAPLGGMVVSDSIIEVLIQYGKGKFSHGYTFSGHPVSVATGLAAINFYKQNHVLQNCQKISAYLFEQLEVIKEKHRIIREVRGKGLLIGLELVPDKNKNNLFQPNLRASERLNEVAMENGAVFYPGSGAIDGTLGEHLLIGPPLNINKEEIDEMLQILDFSLTIFEEELDVY